MTAKELREKRAKLIADARAIRATADEAKRDCTKEEIDQQTRMLADAGLLGQELRNLEDLEREENLSTLPETQRDLSPEAQSRLAAQDKDVRSFLRSAFEGRGPLSMVLRATPAAEARAQNTIAGAAGGFAVAPDVSMYGQIVEAMKFFGGIEAWGATVLNTGTGADLPIATDDDTSNTGTIIAEEGDHSSATDVTMGQRVLKAYMFSSKIIKFSMQLEQDTSFPLIPYLSRKIGMRIGRHRNTKFTTGTGISEPQGVVTAASVGRQFATGFSTTTDFDELKRVKHSVDPAYRDGGSKWMFNDTTARIISSVKDGNGRYLVTDSVREGDPMMLLGHPVVINNDVADMAASAKSVVFGQGAAYYIRNCSEMSIFVLRELYAANGQIGIFGVLRSDGGLIDAGQGPVKLGQNSAT